MADVSGKFFSAKKVRTGVSPSSPGIEVGETLPPVNPPGGALNSVGLTMPSAFTVSNSPLTSNGTIGVAGAGTISQYIRGDGSLETFPSLTGFVPYTGATQNVDLGEYGIDAGFVNLDTTPTGTPGTQGTIYWDDSRSTAALIMNGTTQHIGQDSFFYVKNSTGSTIPKGTGVGFAGTDGASGHLLIQPFLANGSQPSSYFMGVTSEEITNGSFGQVMNFGELSGVNTSGYTAGDLLYASTSVAGAFQTTAPIAPNNIILVAAAINSTNNGTIIVRPSIGSNINNDEGVKITSVADKNLLQYQSGTGLWENKTLAQVLGGTASQFVKGDGSLDSTSYVPSTRNITINGTTQDLSADRTYNVGTVTSVGLSSATSGVTIGSSPVTTSGTITLTIATASGSQNGLLSSTDWTTFNNKQNALTNPVTGTGSAGQVAYWTGTNSQTGNSNFFWDNSTGNLRVNSSISNSNLTVSGSDNTDIFTLLSGINSRLHVGTVTSPNNDVYIRSQNNYALSLGTNSTNYLTILSSGNVGVNTATPATAFEVNGVGLFTGGSLVGNTKNGVYIYDTVIASLAGSSARPLSVQGQTLSIYTGITYSEKVKVFENGNVVISTSPSDNGARLQVSGTATFSGIVTGNANEAFRLDPSSGASYMNFRIGGTSYSLIGIAGATSDIITGSALGDLNIRATNNQKILFSTNNGGSAAMTITSSGNVLIGTTTDSGTNQPLQVVKTGSSNYLRLQADNNASYDCAHLFTDGTNSVYAGMMRATSGLTGAYSIFTGGAVRFNVTSGGNVGIGTTSPNRLLTLGGTSFAYMAFNASSNRNTTIGSDGVGNFIVADDTAATYRMVINSSGNVLIGTTTDNNNKLRVNGQVFINENTQLDSKTTTGVGSSAVAIANFSNSEGSTYYLTAFSGANYYRAILHGVQNTITVVDSISVGTIASRGFVISSNILHMNFASGTWTVKCTQIRTV